MFYNKLSRAIPIIDTGIKFKLDLDEKVDTLLKVDIVDINEADEKLKGKIFAEGMVFFE